MGIAVVKKQSRLPLESFDIEESMKNEIKQFAHERNIRLNDII